jgi:serine protease Do
MMMMITLWMTVFAIPVDITRNVMDQLVRTGKVTRAYMGSFHKMSRLQMASTFGEKEATAALVSVSDVSADSPAQKRRHSKG